MFDTTCIICSKVCKSLTTFKKRKVVHKNLFQALHQERSTVTSSFVCHLCFKGLQEYCWGEKSSERKQLKRMCQSRPCRRIKRAIIYEKGAIIISLTFRQFVSLCLCLCLSLHSLCVYVCVCICVCKYVLVFSRLYLSIFPYKVAVYVGMYLPNPSTTGEMWHNVSFKLTKIGLNPQFSFSYTRCLSKAKEPHLPFYFSIAGEEQIDPRFSQGH